MNYKTLFKTIGVGSQIQIVELLVSETPTNYRIHQKRTKAKLHMIHKSKIDNPNHYELLSFDKENLIEMAIFKADTSKKFHEVRITEEVKTLESLRIIKDDFLLNERRCKQCGSWALINSPGGYCKLCSDVHDEERTEVSDE